MNSIRRRRCGQLQLLLAHWRSTGFCSMRFLRSTLGECNPTWHTLPHHRCAENELEEAVREEKLARFRAHGRKSGTANQVCQGGRKFRDRKSVV